MYEARRQLFDIIGWVCAACGNDQEIPEADHPYGRDWDVRKVNQLTRARRYILEAKRGELRPLCKSCNSSDGGLRQGPKRR